MTYSTFVKIWLKFNVASRENIGYDLVKMLPCVCMIPALVSSGDLVKMLLILISMAGMALINVIRIRPPKMLYIMPVDEQERQRYVKRGFYTRFIIVELIYSIAVLLIYQAGMITWEYLIIGSLGNLLINVWCNEYAMIQVDRVPTKLVNEVDGQFYSVGEKALAMAIMFCGLLMEYITISKNPARGSIVIMTNGPTWILIGIFTVLALGCAMVLHHRHFQERVNCAASYEVVDKIKKQLALAH